MTETTEVRSPAGLTGAIVALAALGPFAEFLALRLQVRTETVSQSLGMPWPAPISNTVQAISVIMIVATVIVSVLGIVRRGSSRAAGIVAIVITVIAPVPVFFVVLVLTFGDPA